MYPIRQTECIGYRNMTTDTNAICYRDTIHTQGDDTASTTADNFLPPFLYSFTSFTSRSGGKSNGLTRGNASFSSGGVSGGVLRTHRSVTSS